MATTIFSVTSFQHMRCGLRQRFQCFQLGPRGQCWCFLRLSWLKAVHWCFLYASLSFSHSFCTYPNLSLHICRAQNKAHLLGTWVILGRTSWIYLYFAFLTETVSYDRATSTWLHHLADCRGKKWITVHKMWKVRLLDSRQGCCQAYFALMKV